MLSYPEVYILGRQVDGVYVEYLHGAEPADQWLTNVVVSTFPK
ncbi:hypothetical protein RG666_06375 [Enterococcus sp. FR191]|nr:hypothetical protein [Enterococcus sp. FR191]MDQ8630536.1 hypothetical protein [Enterococcus sp. FR191]